MAVANLPIVPGTLPPGYCFSTWQQLNLDIVGKAVVQFSSGSFTTIITQAGVPNASDRDKLWYRTTDNRLYQWSSAIGAWVSKHPYSAADKVRQIWVGTTTDLETFDGGAAGTVGDAAGPMWEVDSVFAGRSPMGVGAIPDTTDSIAVGGTYGAGKVTLTGDELPAGVDVDIDVSNYSTGANMGVSGSGSEAGIAYYNGSSDDAGTLEATLNGGGEAHANVHPVYGVYLIKRTARLYYAAP